MLALRDPRVCVYLTAGSAEKAAFGCLSETARLWIGVAAVSFLPPLQLGPGPRPKFPRFHHFQGRK